MIKFGSLFCLYFFKIDEQFPKELELYIKENWRSRKTH